MNINLHIERLVLEGINIIPSESHLLQAGIELELTRMLTNGGLSPTVVQTTTLPRLSTSDIQLTSNNAEQIALKTAQSIYGGIGHE